MHETRGKQGQTHLVQRPPGGASSCQSSQRLPGQSGRASPQPIVIVENIAAVDFAVAVNIAG